MADQESVGHFLLLLLCLLFKFNVTMRKERVHSGRRHYYNTDAIGYVTLLIAKCHATYSRRVAGKGNRRWPTMVLSQVDRSCQWSLSRLFAYFQVDQSDVIIIRDELWWHWPPSLSLSIPSDSIDNVLSQPLDFLSTFSSNRNVSVHLLLHWPCLDGYLIFYFPLFSCLSAASSLVCLPTLNETSRSKLGRLFFCLFARRDRWDGHLANRTDRH